MKKLVLINGPARVGKDTFINLCKEILQTVHIPVYNISSIDPIKLALKDLGWDGIDKSNEIRKALIKLKKISSTLFDGPMNYLRSEIKIIDNGLIFIHIREPEEIYYFLDEYPTTVRLHLNRKDREIFDNSAEKNTLECDYDFYIDNNSTIDNLRTKAQEFLEEISILPSKHN